VVVVVIYLSVSEKQVVQKRLQAGSILCIPSHNVPGFAIFLLYGPVPVGLGPLIMAIALGMAEPYNFSPYNFKVNN
jgi:hypothetical protein